MSQLQLEGRGLKNPEVVKAKQKRREEAERRAQAAGATGDTALKVSDEKFARQGSRH